MFIGSTFLELNNNKLWCIVSDVIIYFPEYNSFVKRFNFTTTVVAKRMKYLLKTKSEIRERKNVHDIFCRRYKKCE